MTFSLLTAIAAATGVYLLFVGLTSAERKTTKRKASRLDEWLVQSGLGLADKRQITAATVAIFIAVAFLAWLLFGGFLVPLLAGGMTAVLPLNSLRNRRKRRLTEAAEAWPRMIDEIRLMCGSLGRPIPQALLEVGKRGPIEYRNAFAEAEREWLLSTDFNRTAELLRSRLADPTADVVCETLVVAHNLGGSDVDQRLAALAADRHADLQGRKDAKAKQAGVIFARRFVLVVPLGMAVVGMSIGNGRDAYSSISGQIGVAVALFILAGCWAWAGHLIKLPQPKRAFRG